ncbi:hypothetical protein AA11825_0960 [Acetobacter pomorum DSM 11825]|nr:hypothetical protein AA11825_0960 [Acetobacter pomorum DSM 11825]
MQSLKRLQDFIKISNDGIDRLMADFEKLHATATRDYLRNATEKTMLREQIAQPEHHRGGHQKCSAGDTGCFYACAGGAFGPPCSQ